MDYGIKKLSRNENDIIHEFLYVSARIKNWFHFVQKSKSIQFIENTSFIFHHYVTNYFDIKKNICKLFWFEGK